MMEYGIVSEKDITYREFLKLFQQENLRRRETAAQGGVVYGPEQYSESGYYHYLHNTRLQELREAMYVKSGKEDITNKFTDKLIEERMKDMQEQAEVRTVSDVYRNIKAF